VIEFEQDLLGVYRFEGGPSRVIIQRGEDTRSVNLAATRPDEDYIDDHPYVAGQTYRTEVRVYRVLPATRYEPGPVPGAMF
jgi:hypothetical protein